MCAIHFCEGLIVLAWRMGDLCLLVLLYMTMLMPRALVIFSITMTVNMASTVVL